MRVLLVKMSSLGDVVHALPAVTDAAAHGIEFDWVVEEAFADIPARHPAVASVIPIGWRRWRHALVANRGEIRDFVSRLRSRQYDLVLDAQGLIKSGVVAGLARGRGKAGLSPQAAREGAAALFYERRFRIPTGQHAVDRVRQLFASAFGYTLSNGVDFGISGARAEGGPGADDGACVLLHGTTWDSKHYPEAMWTALANQAAQAGLSVAVPWGDESERARARRIAAASGATVWERSSLAVLMDRLQRAALVIGVDSGLAHLAAALSVPTTVIYGSTDSVLTGARGLRVANLQAEFSCAPCLQRSCSYVGNDAQWRGEAVQPPCYSRVAPEDVWRAATEVMDADRVLSI